MMLNFWIDIENESGAIQGDGPITSAIDLDIVTRLDRAGNWRFSFPAQDARARTQIQAKTYLSARTNIDGTVTTLASGQVVKQTVKIGKDQEIVSVECAGLLNELARVTTKSLQIESTTTAPASLLGIANLTLPTPWTVSGLTSTSTALYLQFSYESVLNALNGVAAKLGEHFVVESNRRLKWIGPVANFEDSGILATANAYESGVINNADVALIDGISEDENSWDIVNRLYVFGAGQGEARLTLQAATDVLPSGWTYDTAASAINHVGSQSAYGIHESALSVKDIRPLSNNDADLENAANMLLTTGYNWMRRRHEPTLQYDVSLAKCDRILTPGQTIKVEVRRYAAPDKVIDINRTLNILEARTSVDVDGIRMTGLKVSTMDGWPQTESDYLVSRLNQSVVMESHPQMGPSIDTISYSTLLDNTNQPALRFWLGDETTTVNEVVLRFRLDPLVSSVRSVGGTVTGQIDISIPDHDHSVPDHSHFLQVADGNLGTPVYLYQSGGGVGGFESNAGAVTNVFTDSASGSTTSGGGGSFSDTVDLDLANAITAEYGIFEESTANTLSATEAAIQINGSPHTNEIVDEGGGWFSLDCTPDLVNAQDRPLRAANAIVFSTTVDKTASIIAQVERRTVIQAIARY